MKITISDFLKNGFVISCSNMQEQGFRKRFAGEFGEENLPRTYDGRVLKCALGNASLAIKTYVNYYFHTNVSGGAQAIPATFTSIYDFLNGLTAQQKLDLGKDLGMYTQSSTVGHEEYEPSWEAKYPTA